MSKLSTIVASAAFLAVTMAPAFAEDAAKPATTAPAKTETHAKSAATTSKHHAWSKEDIKAVQEALAKGGYYKGEATGVMNKATESALKAWQKANKMPANGKLTTEEVAKLKAA